MALAKGVPLRPEDEERAREIADGGVEKIRAKAEGLIPDDASPAAVQAAMSQVGVLDFDVNERLLLQSEITAFLDGLDLYHRETFDEAVAEVADILAEHVPMTDASGAKSKASQKMIGLLSGLPELARERFLKAAVKASASDAGWEGFGIKDAQQLIDETIGVNETYAKSLSQDTVSDFIGQASELRQRDIGMDSYQWKTKRDDRVRETHKANDRRQFTWEESHNLSIVETGPPGHDWGCRCIAEPVLSDELIEHLQKGAEEFGTGIPEGERDVNPFIYVRDDGRKLLKGSDYPALGALVRSVPTGSNPAGKIMLARAALPFETRQTGDEFIIEGYGLEWDQVADLGWFNETFVKGAFSDVLDDVRWKVGHNYERVALARSPRTMRVYEDDTGLGYEARLDLRSPYAMDLMVAVERGDVDKASIGFTPGDYRYEDANDLYVNTKVDELWEISAVDWPAYESSALGARAQELPSTRQPSTLKLEAARVLADSFLRDHPPLEA